MVDSRPAPLWSPRSVRFWCLVCMVAMAIVFAKNFWISEDAFVQLRSLEQLRAGRGPNWNAGTRVQIYTSIAWYWLVALLDTAFVDVFHSTIFALCALFLLFLLFSARILGLTARLFLFFLILLCSRSFFDYTSAGTENVLAYNVILLSYGYCRHALRDRESAASSPWILFALTALIPFTRYDLVLLLLPAVAFAVFTRFKSPVRAAGFVALAFVPLALWSLFALFYYGKIFPNTAYAKLSHGYDSIYMLKCGLHYLYRHFVEDFLTILVLVSGIVMGAFSRATWQRLFALGVLGHVSYLVVIGGDYMFGRFISYPFVLSALLVADIGGGALERFKGAAAVAVRAAVAAGFAFFLFFSGGPLMTPFGYGRGIDFGLFFTSEAAKGVMDIRALHYQTTLAAWLRGELHADMPRERFVRDALQIKYENKTAVRGAVGVIGYYAGLDVHLVDTFATLDPFRAHLPAINMTVRGHFEREIPAGYVESVDDPSVPLADPRLDEIYRNIRVIFQGEDLWSRERLKAIYDFNTGKYDELFEEYRRDVLKRRPPPPSFD